MAIGTTRPITPLPDCPSCDAAGTLATTREQEGYRWCLCSCCAKTCLVSPLGAVVASGGH